MTVVRELLRSLIDYAGLFPPAGLGMEASVRNFGRYRAGDHRWILGRFVLPAARLEDFERAAAGRLDAADPWPLAVLAGENPEADFERLAAFRRRCPGARIDSVEIKAGSPPEIRSALRVLGTDPRVYVEIPITEPPAGLLDALRQAGARAKIRTGGTRPGMVPSAAEVARFLALALPGSGPRTAWKATAGLHHALRSVRPLTDEAGGASDLMHGFLNLFIAATFSCLGLDRIVPDLLEEREPAQLVFGESVLSWRGHRARAEEVAAARAWAGSFGSCSFEEPVEELRGLGLL